MNLASLLLLLLWNSGAAPAPRAVSGHPAPPASRVPQTSAVGPKAPAVPGSPGLSSTGATIPRWQRDPFQPILPPRPAGPPRLPPGRAGLEVDHLRVVAVALGGPLGPVGMVADAAGHTYFLKPGDRIYDASVLRLSHDGIWFERSRTIRNASQLVFRKVS